MDFSALTVQILKAMSEIAGSYGMAIILLTAIIRLAMWPLSVSQQRSMKKTQELAPKLKEIQERYKSNPQTMQRKMAEFYKEHSFNPFAGCFPLLIQLPIFIMLYSALISPQFIQMAGDSSFLFIKRLDSTMRSHAGFAGDKTFGVGEADTFSASKNIKIFLDKGEALKAQIKHPQKAVEVQGNIIPGEPVDLKINVDEQLDEKFETIDKIKKAEISVVNNSTKEVENIEFVKRNNLLVAGVPTVRAKNIFHYDVLVLVILFGVTMFMSQKLMTDSNKGMQMDPTQQAIQDSMGKMMPIMITGMFVFVPIPAGVLLYMVVSNIIQVVQTVMINKQLENESPKKPGVIDIISSDPQPAFVEVDSEEAKAASAKKVKKHKW